MSFQVSILDSQSSKYSEPMIASNIVIVIQQVLERKFLNEKIPTSVILKDTIRREFTEALTVQSCIRNVYNSSFIRRMSDCVGFEIQHNSLVLEFPPFWVETIDSEFGSGCCSRCGDFVTTPYQHDKMDCDNFVLCEVLET